MTEEVMRFVASEGSVTSEKDEGDDHVLNEEGGDEDAYHAVGRPLGLGKVWRDLLLDESLTHGQEWDRKEKHVVSRIEPVPEGTGTVDSQEISISSDVDVARQPG